MKKPKKISEARILQILNNVAEECIDLGLENFTTKDELFQVILYLKQAPQNNFLKYDKLRSDIFMLYIGDMPKLNLLDSIQKYKNEM